MHSPFNTDYLYYRSARYCDAVKVPAPGHSALETAPRAHIASGTGIHVILCYSFSFFRSPSCVQGLGEGPVPACKPLTSCSTGCTDLCNLWGRSALGEQARSAPHEG